MFRNSSLSSCIVLTIIMVAGASTAMADDVIYSSIPKSLPGNVASEGPEAYAFAELGDGIVFTPGKGGTFQSVTVIMSDWACEHGHWYVPAGSVFPNGDGPCVTKPGAKFSQTIRLNIYSVVAVAGVPTPGALLATTTDTFEIPLRPSSDAAHCGPTGNPGGDGGQWYNHKDKTCYHGLAFPVVFDLAKQAIPIPDRVIVGIQYNTSDYGPAPQRPRACNSLPPPDNDNCPYDSLNISTDSGGFATPPTNTVFVGSFLVPDSIFVNYTSSANACSGNTVTGVLAIDTGCWTGFHPEIEVVSTPRKNPDRGNGPRHP